MKAVGIPGLLSFTVCCLLFFLTQAFCAEQASPLFHVQPKGIRGVGHDDQVLHRFYWPLFNNNRRMSCCHQLDCRPTITRASKTAESGWEVKINDVWHDVDFDDIIPDQAPDSQAHVCAGEPTQMDPLGRVYCVVLPPGG